MRYERGTLRRWRPLDPLEWAIGGPMVAHRVTIPAGREFENSVPWCLRWFIGQDDPRYLMAARVHDFLLECGYGRAQAAAEWYDGAKAGGAPVWKARLAYLAVAAWAVFRE